MTKKTVLLLFINIVFVCAFTTSLHGQNYNPVHAAIPSLQIGSDARAGGMADVGAATTPDVYSQHWNPSKYAAMDENVGFSFSYTPWLRKLVNDIDLVYATGYWRFGRKKENALSTSFRYFSLGDVNVPDLKNLTFWQTVSPKEFAFDIAYSRKLSRKFYLGIATRYIHADYSGANDYTTPAGVFAMDISGYYRTSLSVASQWAVLAAGFNISNIGTKISFDGGTTKMFLPANLKIGTSFQYPINDKNAISVSLDLNKLLVPTPRPPIEGETAEEAEKRNTNYFKTSAIEGIFKSFGDAPGGFKEEMQEIMWALGAEYTYNKQFSLRSGYFHENRYKGNRQYLSFGAGFKMAAFRIDAAYLVATSQANPLDQTLRFSLGVDINGIRNLLNK